MTLPDREQWAQELSDIYDRIRAHKKPYTTNVNGLEIVVLPEVFSPKYFTDTAWFASQVTEIVGDASLLEIGTGTGAVALQAALSGAKVETTDINPAAVRNARLNFRRHGVEVPVYEGDMYEPIPEHNKYDYIFWNHPFNLSGEPVEDMLLRAGFDYEFYSLEELFRHGDKHLHPNGKILLGTGHGNMWYVVDIIAENWSGRSPQPRRTQIPLTEGSEIYNEYMLYEYTKREPRNPEKFLQAMSPLLD